jgi:hypothetical protein
MVSHTSLTHHYSNLFKLMTIHKYALSDIENMIPYELELYIHMLTDHLEKDN